jgi:hypothetical protein
MSISLLVAGIMGVLFVVAEKLLALNWGIIFGLEILILAGIIAGIVVWRFTRPTWMTLALLLDKRAELRERISSIPALQANQDDPFARAALEESRLAVKNVKPARYFPIRAPRRSFFTLGVWGLTVAGWLVLPQGDLLGRRLAKEQQEQKKVQIEQARIETKTAVKKVRQLSDKMNKDLLGDLQDPLAEAEATKNPQQARQQAVRQVADLRKRVEQVRAEPEFGGLEQMERKLRQLRSPDNGPAREMAQQMAKGDFGKAAESLRQLQNKLLAGEMNDQQRKELAEQLESLSQQLQKLAQQQWKMENELKQNGLDPSLAKDLKKLEQALKKSKLSEAQKKKLMQSAKANLAACKKCQGLSNAMQSASENLSSGMNASSASQAMSEIGEKLDELEALKEQMELADATLKDLEKSMGELAEGMGECPGCKGQGCSMCNGKGPWREGESLSRSMGMGGPGAGQGHVAESKKTDTKEEKTRAKSKTGQGPVIASWYIQDSQVKGESVREFSATARSAAQQADESMEEQHVPREYQNVVKRYFSQLSQTPESAQKQKGN